jgi:hypothetical protein
MVLFALNLTLRSRAIFHSMRAAYPNERFQWRRIWGAYFAAVGFNNIVPARGGDVIKLFLAKSSIPRSTYATVAATIYTEAPFDAVVGIIVLIYAFTQGVFPKPPDFAKLDAFDLSFLASNFRLTLFLITALAILGVVAFAVLSRRVVAFWERLRQGLTILRDRRRYLRQVVAFQAVAWLCRAAAFWFFLDAFRIGGSVRQRDARVRRQRRLGDDPARAGRRGHPAGPVRAGLREIGEAGGRPRLFGRAADRDRGADRRRRLHRAGDHLPLPLVQGGAIHAGARGSCRRSRLGRAAGRY